MSVVVITGSGGLVGSEAVRSYASRGDVVVGIDNDMRAHFFGSEASTRWRVDELRSQFRNYLHRDVDIRNAAAVDATFSEYGSDVRLVLHAAAQPSHDHAATDPVTDFTVNANGTLTLLEATRRHAPSAVFVQTSTNKVYGDRPNQLPLTEQESRWELPSTHPLWNGVDESMSIDSTMHSLFGASKVGADVLVQEYGRYFGLRTGVFRCGCITGPGHSGARLHGFLAYLMKQTTLGEPYQVYGYKGKQVRDNIHVSDLLTAFDAFAASPRCGAVYNLGGGRQSNCSVIEAIELCQQITGRRLPWSYVPRARRGDHIWWISDNRKFQRDYPGWRPRHDTSSILHDIHEKSAERWRSGV